MLIAGRSRVATLSLAVCSFVFTACLDGGVASEEELKLQAQEASWDAGTGMGSGTEGVGVFPQQPWVAPTLLVNSHFPGGVLSFGTVDDFINFYSALESTSKESQDSQGTAPFSAVGTASATINYASFWVSLQAGQVLELGTCDIAGASFSGDTYLRLTAGSGEVAANDDACGGTGSRISYSAPTSGSYEVRVGCFSDGACSGTVGYSIVSPSSGGGVSGVRSFKGSATGSATTQFSTLTLNLAQGQTIDVGTCGLSGTGVVGDTYLRLVDVDGNVEVAVSDDACGTTASRITYTAARTGAYELRMGCFSSTDCAGSVVYNLSAPTSPADAMPSTFVSAKRYLENVRPGERPGDAIVDVDYAEFVDDLKAYLVPDEALSQLVDRDLQMVVEGKLYQLTSMGVFQVDMASIASFRTWLNANSYAMNTNPNFQSIPGEVALPNGSFQVIPGVIRTVGNMGSPSLKLLGFDEDGSVASAQAADAMGRLEPVREAAPQPDEASSRQEDSPFMLSSLSGDVTSLGDKGAEQGRISYWSGKVNAHKAPGGAWLKDSDCSSGANIPPLTYCRKFFPGTNSVVAVPVSPKPANLWNTSGCAQTYSGDGLQEWICDGASPPAPSCHQTPTTINYPVYTVGSNFRRSESINFGNKRFVFKAKSPGFLFRISGNEVGFHKIEIKAKVQRKKRFLGIGYWGPSYGDEIIVGVENMKLDTDFIAPYPQTYQTLSKPKFNGLANFKVGNWAVEVMNISVNFNPPGPGRPITTDDVAKWISSGFNSVVGTVYNNIWKVIETNIIAAIDFSYLEKYAKYTKMVNALDEAHRLKYALGRGEKPQCYSHKNTWWFDANAGVRYLVRGGVPGPPGSPPTKVNYKYSMKAGSFYGRARVDGNWYGIRMVRMP
ncbi:hypothetical protein OWM54_32195 [Myxococcus sp. MISCRS1]|uniref:hypothetical protein n=1 Tax=Myxococcus sp. MISCRS1 TaxID=2996786 RepID=UPI002270CEF4|nr:hypothetical protein [Myxococcus sp. MISCRS1]MCY1001826.1 hypothetical protein [Myxococcus sp. MISCRS1]